MKFIAFKKDGVIEVYKEDGKFYLGEMEIVEQGGKTIYKLELDDRHIINPTLIDGQVKLIDLFRIKKYFEIIRYCSNNELVLDIFSGDTLKFINEKTDEIQAWIEDELKKIEGAEK